MKTKLQGLGVIGWYCLIVGMVYAVAMGIYLLTVLK